MSCLCLKLFKDFPYHSEKLKSIIVWHNFLQFSTLLSQLLSSLFHEHPRHAHASGPLHLLFSFPGKKRDSPLPTVRKIEHSSQHFLLYFLLLGNYWHFKYIYLFILYIKSQQGSGFYQFYSLLSSLVLKTVPCIEWARNKYLSNELTTIKMVWFI